MKTILFLAFILITSIVYGQQHIDYNQYKGFIIKNESGRKMSVSIVYFDAKEQCWISRGWYNLDKGDSMGFRSSYFNLGNRILYAHAQNRNRNWGNDVEFCIRQNDSFVIYYADKGNCSTSAGYAQFQLTEGVTYFSFTR